MMKYRISLITLDDIRKFVDIMTDFDYSATLENEQGTYRINARSFLGAVAAVEDWKDIWVVSDSPNLYTAVKDFVV